MGKMRACGDEGAGVSTGKMRERSAGYRAHFTHL